MNKTITPIKQNLPTLIIAIPDKLKAELIALLESKKLFKVQKILNPDTDVFEELSESKPDYLLIDTTFPKEGGFGFIKKLNRIKPATKVIIYSNSTNPELLKVFFNSPGLGFIQQGCSLNEFVSYLRAIFEGRRVVFSKVENSDEAKSTKYRKSNNGYDLSVLSDRELDVWELLSEAKREKQIAESLFISLNTVKTHKSNISKKLGIKNDQRLSTFVMKS